MNLVAILVLLLFPQFPPAQVDSGIVTGTLLNGEGKPATGIRVAAMALPQTGATDSHSLMSIAVTGKDGQYRLENIPPGRYLITAGLIEAPIYYPGVREKSGAKEVQVFDGRVTEKVDFTMIVPGFDISGHFAVQPALRNPAPIVLYSRLSTRVVPLQSDGSFEFLRVLPGEYTVQNSFGLPEMPLVVTDQDITGVEIGIGQGVRVAGKVVSPGTIPNGLNALRVILTGPSITSLLSGASNSGNPQLSVFTKSDGTFDFPKVPPGNYSVRVLSHGENVIASLTVGGGDVTGLGYSFPPLVKFRVAS